jgi:hypothetical protein
MIKLGIKTPPQAAGSAGLPAKLEGESMSLTTNFLSKWKLALHKIKPK